MKSGWFNTAFSALVGGVIGAVIVIACGPYFLPGLPETIEKLKVKELIVSEKMMLWEDGQEDCSLLIQNGGILGKTRIIATQFCANTVTANAILTTPDNPLKPLNECEIFTEMASSKNEGGMLTVRSPNGGNVLGNPNGVQTGLAYTISYDSQGTPVCFFRANDSGQRLLGQYIALAPGQNGTIAIMTQPAPPADNLSAPAAPMNPAQGMPMQGNNMPNPGEQNAMITPIQR